jgi:hypothetical protein
MDASLVGTTQVHVRKDGCTCGASRWFNCRCGLDVCTYEIATYDTVPDRVQLTWIRDQHPGCALIYFDPTEAR